MRPLQRAAFQRTLVHSARTDIWDIFLVDHELAIFHVLHVRYTDALNMRIVWPTQCLKPSADKSMSVLSTKIFLFLQNVFSAATGHWKNIWSLGRKNILYFNCLNLGKSCLKNSVDFSIACSTRKKVSKKVILKKTSGVWRPKINCLLIAWILAGLV